MLIPLKPPGGAAEVSGYSSSRDLAKELFKSATIRMIYICLRKTVLTCWTAHGPTAPRPDNPAGALVVFVLRPVALTVARAPFATISGMRLAACV